MYFNNAEDPCATRSRPKTYTQGETSSFCLRDQYLTHIRVRLVGTLLVLLRQSPRANCSTPYASMSWNAPHLHQPTCHYGRT